MSKVGDNETITDRSFLNRYKYNIPPYNSQVCPDPNKNHEWAELKSSLLIQQLSLDRDTNARLVDFLQALIYRIFTYININYVTEFIDYFNNYVDYYPVTQRGAFSDPNVAWNDVYFLYSFIKHIWMKLNQTNYFDPINNCNKESILGYSVINMLQQKLNFVLGLIRGKRVDMPRPLPVSQQIGITNFINTKLNRKVLSNPNYNPRPWMHPGTSQCRVPYIGTYGKHIRENKSQNNYYGSLQCGISGSTNFILYMYLFSLKNDTSREYTKNVLCIIILGCMILTGDGGHNIREVISGFSMTIIMLYHMVNSLKTETNNFTNVTYGPTQPSITYLRNFIINNRSEYNIRSAGNCVITVDDIIKEFIRLFRNWEPFINEFYRITQHINIVGLTADDDITILNPDPNMFNSLLQHTFRYAFSNNDFNVDFNIIQRFFAKDSNRYLQDFQNSTSNLITQIIQRLPNGNTLLNNVRNLINNKQDLCGKSIDELIPFAFKNSSKFKLKTSRKASRRVSRKASRRVSRKASRRVSRKASRRVSRKASRRVSRKASRRVSRKASRRVSRKASRRVRGYTNK
jgi:hypothetical protein